MAETDLPLFLDNSGFEIGSISMTEASYLGGKPRMCSLEMELQIESLPLPESTA